ncbi:helix-turn-helix domain-containing protein [uncultured Pseudosulfitobacter sp.]|uniref:helix-turn-helix domain-containing protein n=1 Tax=uncultured Pseudosulfitobacter sp. TaxID=2854214 RepID=UPI0030DD373F|tara:strand:- start:684 stop:926 length:243 start_codon:yes stop_codon:yes gene_type:complete
MTFKSLTIAMNLTRLAKTIVAYMEKNGSISARAAAADLDITSASLTRRLTDIEDAGIPIKRERRVHPVTGKRYTRYSLDD